MLYYGLNVVIRSKDKDEFYNVQIWKMIQSQYILPSKVKNDISIYADDKCPKFLRKLKIRKTKFNLLKKAQN